MARSIFLLLLALLGISTLVTPLPINTSSSIAGRDDTVFRGGIYYCNGAAFTGPCRWQYIYPEDRKGQTCVWLRLEGGIASVGPDYGIDIDIFTDPGCTNLVTGPLTCPGWPNMGGFWRQGYDTKNADAWAKVRDIPLDQLEDPKQQATERQKQCSSGPYAAKKGS